METAFTEMARLVDIVHLFVDGFVWNPFSPNTAALRLLRTEECFLRTAELLKSKAGSKLKLVKMGPYETLEEKGEWLGLLWSWMNGGGDGLVATNAYLVPRSEVPSREWGYLSAGRSGKFLQDYRDRAVRDARKEFPGATIVATGGVDSGKQAWKSFEAGADLLEGFTPYTFEGFGLLIKMAKELEALLKQAGYATLAEFVGGRRVAKDAA
jgi:dihydroorotate dehydrogenase